MNILSIDKAMDNIRDKVRNMVKVPNLKDRVKNRI